MFCISAGTFGRNYVTKKLQEEIRFLSCKRNSKDHSFWRRAATSARFPELSEEEIQPLGRWKLNSYSLYIETHPDWIYNASLRHQLIQKI